MPDYDVFDLEAAVKNLAGRFKEIDAVYLFGSRRFGTGSIRSDIDIIILVNQYIMPSALRDYTLETNSALDIFVLSDGRAISAANESYITGKTNEDVLSTLNAILLYERSRGSSSELQKWKALRIDTRAKYEMTALPNISNEAMEVNALLKILGRAAEQGLPTKPYLGKSTREVIEFIVKVIRMLPNVGQSVTGHGNAKDGWTAHLANEYDFQNLFWIVTKPWLPDLDREQIALVFDGNEKRSDFSLFKSQLIIELKHIKDGNSKRAILKTLTGLKDFYVQHPNVRVLIFGILVDEEVDLDDALWESQYSHPVSEHCVYTILVRNPKK